MGKCASSEKASRDSSDLFGVIYTDMDDAGGWKQKLVMELKAAKLEFDPNSFWR